MSAHDKILQIIAQVLDVDPNVVTPEKTFQDLGIDSITFIKISVQCEMDFGIQMDDDMILIDNYDSVQMFLQYLTNNFELQ